MRKEYFSIIFATVFGGIGTLFIIIAIVAGVVMGNQKKTMVSVDAYITDIGVSHNNGETNHTVLVTYKYDGVTYEDVNLRYYTSTMYVGSPIEILVDPQNPAYISQYGAVKFLVFIFGFIGAIFSAIGYGFLIHSIKIKKLRKRLFHEGKRLYGTIDSINVNYNVSINHRHPVYPLVVVKDEYAGEDKFFRGDDVLSKDAETLHVGDEVIVYVDREDERKYLVDTTGANSVMGSTMSEYY